jgi:UDP-N-acetylmuramate dehydrogenase
MRRDESLARHTSWRVGGGADYFVEPDGVEELKEALAFAKARGLPWLVIGEGTNLLFADEGYRGVVIKLGSAFGHWRIEGLELEAGAGALVCRLSRKTCLAGLTGIEHIVGIPGTLGGLIVMNGGSLRRSVGDSLMWVEVLNESGWVQRWSAEECGFSYRTSRFQKETAIVLSARLRLAQGRREVIRSEMLRILRDRRRKFPRKIPNCGSVFKSCPQLFAKVGPPGRIIEDCGFKGMRLGDAEVSPLHANFITNVGRAKAVDILELVRRIRMAVHEKCGVWMDAEAKYVFPDGRIVSAHEVGEVGGNGIKGTEKSRCGKEDGTTYAQGG